MDSALLYFSHLIPLLIAAWIMAAVILMPDGDWREFLPPIFRRPFKEI